MWEDIINKYHKGDINIPEHLILTFPEGTKESMR